MQPKNIPQKMRSAIAPFADRLGIGQWLRQGYVEINQTGERMMFLLTGRPDPSTAILLAGSGRSGTTWLQEVLCTLPRVQPIFEPLHPRFNPEMRRLTGFDSRDPYLRAWYLPPDEEQPAWTTLFEKVLTGRFRNYWTDYERRSYFPLRYLIKVIRANMMLRYLFNRFHSQIIYIIRHPCAVVHSRLQVGWHADVNDLLIQEALVEDYLRPWLSDIEKEKDLLDTHAIWWAVENRVALDQLSQIPHHLLYYEEMVMHPKETISNVVSWLGYPHLPPDLNRKLSQPSRMSNQNIAYQNQHDRLQRWQQSISKADCQRILKWAHRFGLTMYDEHALPKHMRG